MREFPPFRLDTVNQCLWRCEARGEERILLTPKAFTVLRYLVENAGRLVTQDELLEAVWPNTFVQPEVLKYQIADIRNNLGDRARNPLFIETLPRRGYRFIAEVRDWKPVGPPVPASPARGKLIGRDRALSSLQDCLRRTLEGQRQIVFITGEPGIGKSALVDEFQRCTVAGEPSVRIARGQCAAGYGGKEPYYPMLQALTQLCRGPGGDSVIRILDAQAPTWLAQLPALIKRERREMLQREILGATREHMLREIEDALESIASETPLMLIFADLHWADPSTVDLISALARHRGPSKLMVLGTYRPPDEPPNRPLKALTGELLVRRLCREIVLEPLTKAEITEYLTANGHAKPPEGLAALLCRRSEGNPLLMVAALEQLEERGLISREHGCWQCEVSLEEIDPGVPDDLRKTIEAQIERLSTAQQRALEAASINGVLFSVRVNAAPGIDEERFEDLCEGVSRSQHMVRRAGLREFPDGTASQRYEFVHSLYREVFYQRQTPGRRAKRHLRVGERLEELFAGHENEVAAELAEHFEKASDWPRAVKYLQLAAATAERRFEPRQAAEILDHALELAKKLPGAKLDAKHQSV